MFNEVESRRGGPPAVLIGDRLWRQRFGADRAVFGRSITLNDEPFAVVGVTRPGFAFPSADVDIWIAQQFSERDRAQRRAHNFAVIARLKGDHTVEARPGFAPADLVPSIRFALSEIDPLQSARTVDDLYAENTARRRFAMQLTLGFAALALLLGALGIYAIVAYSVAERRREIGIRLALGARPRTVLRQVVRSALGLAGAGAARSGRFRRLA